MMFQTILHPTDFSEHSAGAFEVACSLARDHSARVVVVHVASPFHTAMGGAIPPSSAFESEARRLQIELEKLRPAVPGVAVEHLLLHGGVVDSLIRAVRQTDADLIVMGTHGRTGILRLLMGSVAEYMVRKAPCMVLTVKAGRATAMAAAPSDRREEQPTEATEPAGD